MVFDQHIEADSVDDLGIVGHLVRAPLLGIMWLLGGDHSHGDGEEETKKQMPERKQLEDELSGDSDDEGDGIGENSNVSGSAAHGSSDACSDDSHACTSDDESPDTDVSEQPMPSQHDLISRAEAKCHDKENKDPSSLQNWPSVNYLESPPKEDASKYGVSDMKNNARPLSSAQSPAGGGKRNTPSNQVIDDLVSVMESSRITSTEDSSQGPATSAVLSSQDKMTSYSSTSLSASYSASTFSNHHNPSQNSSLHSSLNNGSHPSQTSNETNNSLNKSLRGSKKMSWSDECGNRSLVEYSYFDETKVQPQSKHWSAMRRNGLRAASKHHSFDGGDGRTRREEKVLKGVLRRPRSGSYSPPTTSLYANSSIGANSLSTSSSSGSSSSTSTPQMKSFRSLSVIGSDSSSRSNSIQDEGKESANTLDTHDSMAAVTDKKLNSNDVQCVPSTLQSGCGRTDGRLIIPRGPYNYPMGSANDPRYQLLLGQQAGSSKDQEEESKSAEDEKVGSSPSRPHGLPSGRLSPGHHGHFLPRHNGYISPQYGFYVNITPPTPEMYAAKGHLKPGDKASRSVMQQSYQQFQSQNKYQAPSPIPEGGPGGPQGIPQRYVGRATVPRPSSNRSSSERESSSAGRKMKPTFTNNKKGMGMLLAENPGHHGVWPTVPFG